MKFVLTTIAIATVSFLQGQQYTINGTVPKTPDGTSILLYKRVGDDFKIDSTKFSKNKFVLTGELESEGNVYIQVVRKDKKRYKGDILEAYIGAENITLTTKDSMNNAELSGSTAHNDYKKVTTAIKVPSEKIAALGKQYETAANANDKAKAESIEEEIEKITTTEMWDAYKAYILANPNSSVSLTAFDNMVGYDIEYNRANPIWLQIDEKLRSSKAGLGIQKKLDLAYKTRVGAVAPVFIQNDVNEKSVSITDLKGKYVLIDFWASWCGPCRAENPNVVANYEKFKEKNFTVLGVSLDEKKDRWVKAIKDDKLDWAQVSDLKGWKNAAAAEYGVKAIPQNFLINPDGVIIARNLRAKGLSDKLAELLK